MRFVAWLVTLRGQLVLRSVFAVAFIAVAWHWRSSWLTVSAAAFSVSAVALALQIRAARKERDRR